MSSDGTLRITNYNAALGRVLGAFFLLGILGTLYIFVVMPLMMMAIRAGLFHWSMVVTGLILLLAPLACILAFRNAAFWVELGGKIRVRLLSGVKTYGWADIDIFELGEGVGVNIGASGRELRLCFKSGKKLTLKVSGKEEARVVELLAAYKQILVARNAQSLLNDLAGTNLSDPVALLSLAARKIITEVGDAKIEEAARARAAAREAPGPKQPA